MTRYDKGTYKYSDGRVYEGAFVDGMFHGQGKLIYPDGRIYEGEWKKGDPWTGKLYHPAAEDGTQIIETYKEGKVVSEELVSKLVEESV